jgi:hypothetical protein
VWVCLEPASCGCVSCSLRFFVFGLGSSPFGAHALWAVLFVGHVCWSVCAMQRLYRASYYASQPLTAMVYLEHLVRTHHRPQAPASIPLNVQMKERMQRLSCLEPSTMDDHFCAACELHVEVRQSGLVSAAQLWAQAHISALPDMGTELANNKWMTADTMKIRALRHAI